MPSPEASLPCLCRCKTVTIAWSSSNDSCTGDAIQEVRGLGEAEPARSVFSGEKISDFKGIGSLWLITFGCWYERLLDPIRLPNIVRNGTDV